MAKPESQGADSLLTMMRPGQGLGYIFILWKSHEVGTDEHPSTHLML